MGQKIPRIFRKSGLVTVVDLDLINRSFYDLYLQAIEDLWGLSKETAEKLGVMGNELFEAEFAVHGAKAYNNSVIMPIRNAFYSYCVLFSRHHKFFSHVYLDSPVLDYGCGVGYQLLWLKHLFPTHEFWGYDVPGPQEQLTRYVFDKKGINFGIPEKPQTILCFHVLEHLDDPFAKIDELRTLGGQLYASCVWDKGHGHVVDEKKAKEVIAYLRKENEFVEDHWGDE
jgi:hypothetical protein